MIRVGRDYPLPYLWKTRLVFGILQINLKQSVLERLTPDKPQFGSAGTIYDLDPQN